MKKLGFIIALTCVLITAKGQQAIDTVLADTKDVVTVDAITAALYDVISGPAGQKRNWNRFRSLFAPAAKLIPTGIKENGPGARRVMTVEEYISSSGPHLEKDGFFEKEIGRKMESFGSIAHIFSTYETKRKPSDPALLMRGINSIQLWNDGKRWWIINILWHNESKEVPIPAKYIN